MAKSIRIHEITVLLLPADWSVPVEWSVLALIAHVWSIDKKRVTDRQTDRRTDRHNLLYLARKADVKDAVGIVEQNDFRIPNFFRRNSKDVDAAVVGRVPLELQM